MVGAAFERSRGLAAAAATVALFCFCAEAVRKVPGSVDGHVGVDSVQERTEGESEARAHFLDDMKPEGALEEDAISCYHGRVFTIRLPESEPAKKDGSLHYVRINSTSTEGSPTTEVYVEVKDSKREFLLIPPAGSTVEHWMLLYRRAALQTSSKDWPWIEERLFKLGNAHPCSAAEANATPQTVEEREAAAAARAEAWAQAAMEAKVAKDATSTVPPSWMASYYPEDKDEAIASAMRMVRSAAEWAVRKVKSALPFGRSNATNQASNASGTSGAAGADAVGEAGVGANNTGRAKENMIAGVRARIHKRAEAAEEFAHWLSAGRTRAAQKVRDAEHRAEYRLLWSKRVPHAPSFDDSDGRVRQAIRRAAAVAGNVPQALAERYERTRNWLAAGPYPNPDDSDWDAAPGETTAEAREDDEVKADVVEVKPDVASSASASQKQLGEIGAPEVAFEAGAGEAKDEDALSTEALAPEVVGS